MSNLSSSVLLKIFESFLLNDSNFEQLSTGKNPCHFNYAGREFYAYIKNLSPAYFSNEDVWRAQLTDAGALEEIKASDATFVLIGYDDRNRVFATWNPYFTKQRIGTSSSPSFYSRLSEQVAVGTQFNLFKKLSLSNDQEVLLFNAYCLPQYLADVDAFFSDGEYVALGSKRRTEANKAFRTFNDIRHIEPFKQYATSTEEAEMIRNFIKDGLFRKYKHYFLKYDSIGEYKNAIADISNAQELDVMQLKCLEHYHAYHMQILEPENQENADETIDWEIRNIDKDGKLFRITNPKLVQQLKKFMYDTEYPNSIGAINTASEFYAGRFQNMSLSDWMKAVKNIIWDINEAISISNGEYEAISAKKENGKRRMFLLQGRGPFNLRHFVFEAVNTFIDTIGDAPFEEIKDVFPKRSSGGELFVTDKKFSQLRDDQKERYFHEDGQVFSDCDGTRFYLSNQWKISYALEKIMPLLDDYGIAWEELKNEEYNPTKSIV